MSVMRLHVESWFGVPAIPAFEEDVDFNSSGVWITIECPIADWAAWRLLSPRPERLPASICGQPGHIVIIDSIPDALDLKRLRLFVKLKFYALN